MEQAEQQVEQTVQAEPAGQAEQAEQAVEQTSPEAQPLSERNERFKWYILHAYSGFERKVRESIQSRVEAFGLSDRVGRVMIPTEQVTEIVIDGGNSLFEDTNRRQKYVESKGLLYIGTGVSGGEEGARRGPSIMPGGSPAAWPHVKDIFQAVSAKVEDGSPCCDWVGEGGAGHYVKMVHNGIEYGDMQLICEAYGIMKNGLGITAAEMHQVFAEWNTGELDSYLIEITRDILAKQDEDGSPLVDKILDTAGQKGTGKWTVINSQELGIPITLMAEAVYSRCVSALKEERVKAARKLKGPRPALAQHRRQPGEEKGVHCGYQERPVRLENRQLRPGLHAHARGGQGIRMEPQLRRHRPDVARRLHHPLAFPGQDQGGLRHRIRSWPTCCWTIISAAKSRPRKRAGATWWPPLPNAASPCPHSAPPWRFSTNTGQPCCRRICYRPSGIILAPTPTSAWTSPRGEFFHTNWTGRGGTTSSSTYNA